MIEKFRPYLGYDGDLSQKDLDQGDSCQRVSTFYFLASIAGLERDYHGLILDFGFLDYIKRLRLAPGIYRRSTDPNYWGSNPDNLSRDQHSILMLAMAQMGFKAALSETFWSIIKRFGFHQNTHEGTDGNKKKIPDFLTPAEIAVFIRGTQCKWLYPILWPLDLCFFLDLYFRKRNKWDYDNLLCQQLLYAVTTQSTYFSKKAFHKYMKTDFLDCIRNYYFCQNGIEPMFELFLIAVKHINEKESSK